MAVRTLAAGFLAAAVAVLAGPAVGDDKPGDKPAKGPKGKVVNEANFVSMAASDGLHEVQLGKMAQSQAASDEVKKFGEKMVADHTKANEELTAAAKAAGIPVPKAMLPKHAKHVEMFKNKKGEEFDKAFMAHAVKDHEESVALFKGASENLRNPGLKEFATKTLPVLEEHLKMAKELHGKSGGGKSGGSDR